MSISLIVNIIRMARFCKVTNLLIVFSLLHACTP